ncbi:hypothetical protein FLACHUCJ7_01107 [Flavobacterium chungangense]|uniref:Uncharacterized protein n=1 Tax=Flavobacterium chungangense TaxID=554283 RepID=A0A6V6YTP1_9FLAO|nr:hypothetical protein FLACHUCJ7_01107 [Flavobacterium chungangense]
MLFQNKKQKPPLERLAVFLCVIASKSRIQNLELGFLKLEVVLLGAISSYPLVSFPG